MTLVVGLTGNIASGKSTVARFFAAKGATIIDADELARRAVEPGTPALSAIAMQWPDVIASDGTLDRAALRRIVFADPAQRAALDGIVHPEVGRLRDVALTEARARGDRIVVYDVPLLFEAGLDRDVDVIVLVDAPVSVRRARLIADRGLTPQDADAMIAAQQPAAENRRRAHYVIDNGTDRATLTTRVNALWDALANAHPRG